jgi:membrane-associated protein
MLEFLNACLALDPVAMLKAGGYIGLFLVVFAESGLLIGILFPGDSLLFAAGLLAGVGIFDPVIVVGGVILAGILGDNVGYWFGKNVGVNFFKRPDSFIFKQEYVRRTEKFYEKYGPQALVLARFVPIVRTLTPILAGVAKMEYNRFLAYNTIGAVVWGAGVTLLGYFLGELIPGLEEYILPISLVIIVVSFLPIIWNFLSGKKKLF